MDADLQDQPEVIPEFVRHHEAGADVVFARRKTREEGLVIRAAYRVFYRLIASLVRCDAPAGQRRFRAARRSRCGGSAESSPSGSAICVGCVRGSASIRWVSTSIARRDRPAGRNTPPGNSSSWPSTGYVRSPSFRFVPRRSQASSPLPGRWHSRFYAIYVRLAVGQVPEGFTASLLIMTFLSGVQLLFLGVIGDTSDECTVKPRAGRSMWLPGCSVPGQR